MFFDGSEVPLSSYQGKNVVVLFWATWCTFSRSVIERYEALARQYVHNGDLEFIAVSVDKNEDFGALKDRIKEQDLKTMTHIFSGNDALDDAFVNLNGKHIPYVVFIDTTGTIRSVDTDIVSLEEYLMLRFGRRGGAHAETPRYSETAGLDGLQAD
jgi:thiol-disulfide isomerase/thioredoxin